MEVQHGSGGEGPRQRLGMREAAFAKFAGSGGPFGPGGDGELLHGHGGGHGGPHWHGGPPPWRGGRRARRGDTRWALLVALLDGPGHGYELIGRLEARTGGVWRPSAGSVYPTLQLLEDEGLIAGHDADGKRVFELTDEGRAAATEASERIGQAPWGGAGQHADFRQAMRTLVLAVRQVIAAGDDTQVSAAVAVLTEARQKLYRILAGETAGTATEPSGNDSAPDLT
jgi:DNA-binding PadR family transcriptional regulator